MRPSGPPATVPAALAAAAIVLAACTSNDASPASAASASAVASHVGHATSAEPSESQPTETAPPEAGDASEEAVEQVEVRLQGDFDPAELTVAAGTTVLFVNVDSYPHTVTEGTGGQAAQDPIVDAELAADDTVRVTFDDAITYELTCRFHPSMQMTITVEG